MEMVSYANPLYQSISVLTALLMVHMGVTIIIFLMTLLTDLFTESYFYAAKSFHIMLPFWGIYFASIAYQKSFLEITKKIDFLDSKMIVALIVCFGLGVVDCVFFGLDAAPVLIDCYQELIPPSPQCDTLDRKRIYTLHVAILIAHIVLEVIIFFALLWVRWASTGDTLYRTCKKSIP